MVIEAGSFVCMTASVDFYVCDIYVLRAGCIYRWEYIIQVVRGLYNDPVKEVAERWR